MKCRRETLSIVDDGRGGDGAESLQGGPRREEFLKACELHEALQDRSFPLKNEQKSHFSLGQYFAYNFCSEKDEELAFSPLKSASKTASSNVCRADGVIGRYESKTSFHYDAKTTEKVRFDTEAIELKDRDGGGGNNSRTALRIRRQQSSDSSLNSSPRQKTGKIRIKEANVLMEKQPLSNHQQKDASNED
ncbi:unnamed protein product [Didymodactylos carnosus]|uniref:Uncharacterized protein n=2 Tax=Didymodactylos carnosus TaxID=1234261 RepID=A0A815FXH0_9BILA|nr:unnamed protein product [Didymodactylos carnosus]CAF4184938.1 unnamed protein product [Didymodactylos carnosus]